MATSTPNYALVKPAYNEWADITVLNNNLDIIDTQIFAKASKTRQIIAGLGLTGGGDLTTDRTLNIASANDGIIANADNIQLDTQNVLTSTAVNKPLSANMGKYLYDNKANNALVITAGSGLTGGGDLTTDRTLNVVSATDGITSNADNIQLNTIDNLTTISSTKPLSATQGKWLKDKKIEDKGLLGTIDLNTLDATSMGVWYQDSDANTSIERNYPSDGLQAGYLGVFKSGVFGDSCIQEYVSYYSNKKFRRSYAGNTQAWTAWAECYDSNNPQPLDTQNVLTSTSETKPLSANMGKVLQDTKLNLTGGTLTGALNGTSANFTNNVEAKNLNLGNSSQTYSHASTTSTNGSNFIAIVGSTNTDRFYIDNSVDYHTLASEVTNKTTTSIIKRDKTSGAIEINATTATFSGDITAPNIITNTSVGTCTTLFSGTQQCGQATWKDTGIDIPTTYSSVLIGVNIASSGLYDTESEFSRCTLTRGQTFLFAHQTQDECILGKIIGNRLWTYATGIVNMADNSLKTVIGITRR